MKFEFRPVKAHTKWQAATPSEWQDWRWQMRSSLKSEADFDSVFSLSECERLGFRGPGGQRVAPDSEPTFQIRTSPYYASLADPLNEQDPIRRIFMPRAEEFEAGLQQMKDPLAEKRNQKAPRVIHRYADRVLFLVTDLCSVYCRFCTRKHFTGHDQAFADEREYTEALDYIRSHPGICEVILSGGDPLTLSDSLLERVLSDLRTIDHVEIIRIGTRMPTVNPFRVTPELAAMIRKYAPVYVMTHFSHPRELTFESAKAIASFVDHGIPLMNQFVLLNGINNHEAIVQALCRRLLYLRVKPYYFMQCDPSEGTDHLRTSIEDSARIQRELWGHLSGLALPQFSIDLPSGGGKVAMVPEFQTAQSGQVRFYKGFDGVESSYVSPPEHTLMRPLDTDLYLCEWEAIKAAKGLAAERVKPLENGFRAGGLDLY